MNSVPTGYHREQGAYWFSDGSGPYAIGADGVPYLMATAPSSGGGAAGAVTVADGADVALGAKADSSATSDAGSFSLVSLFKRLLGKTPALGTAASAAAVPVVLANDDAQIGTKTTSSTMPTGGAGIVGWLSAQYALLAGWAGTTAAAASNILSVQTPDLMVSGNITAQNTNLTTGSATANSTVLIPALNGTSGLIIEVTGTWTGSMVVQGTLDGALWTAIPIVNLGNPGSSLTAISSGVQAIFAASVSGFAMVRVSGSATMTGLPTVTLRAGAGGSSILGLRQMVNIEQAAGATLLVSGSANGASGNAPTVGIAGATTMTDLTGTFTATANGAIVADTSGSGAAYSFLVNVTAASGTTPMLDLVLQESKDGGTTWRDVYHVERITAVTTVSVPARTIARRRWVYTIAGTTPSFTISITATRLNLAPSSLANQYFDRTANVLSGVATAATAWYDMSGCKSISAFIPLGTAATPATYQLQLSADGVTPLPGGAATAAVASTTTSYVMTQGLSARFARLLCTSAGSSQVAATGTGAQVTLTGA